MCALVDQVSPQFPHGGPPRHPHGVEEEVQGPSLLQEGLGLEGVFKVGGEGFGPKLLGELPKRPRPPPGKEKLVALQRTRQSASQASRGAQHQNPHALRLGEGRQDLCSLGKG